MSLLDKIWNNPDSTPEKKEDDSFKYAALGFRCWFTGDGTLQAAVSGTIWRTGLNLAYCNSNQHQPPGENCNCGFNSFYTLPKEDLIRRTNEDYTWGAIAMSGESRLHGKGARTGQVVTIALYSPKEITSPEKLKDLLKISEDYKIQVFDDREDFLEFAQKYATYQSEKTIITGDDIVHAVGHGVLGPYRSAASTPARAASSSGTTYSTPVATSNEPVAVIAVIFLAVPVIIAAVILIVGASSRSGDSGAKEETFFANAPKEIKNLGRQTSELEKTVPSILADSSLSADQAEKKISDSISGLYSREIDVNENTKTASVDLSQSWNIWLLDEKFYKSGLIEADVVDDTNLPSMDLSSSMLFNEGGLIESDCLINVWTDAEKRPNDSDTDVDKNMRFNKAFQPEKKWCKNIMVDGMPAG